MFPKKVLVSNILRSLNKLKSEDREGFKEDGRARGIELAVPPKQRNRETQRRDWQGGQQRRDRQAPE